LIYVKLSQDARIMVNILLSIASSVWGKHYMIGGEPIPEIENWSLGLLRNITNNHLQGGTNMNWNHRVLKVGFTFSLFFLICFSSVFATENQFSVTIPDSKITFTIGTDGYTIFKGATLNGIPGDPQLPVENLSILLPPDTLLKSIKLSIENPTYEMIDGRLEIHPVPPLATNSSDTPVWPTHAVIVNGRNTIIYNQNQFYPATNIGRVSTGQQREWHLAELQLFRFQYNPVTKTLKRLTGGALVLTYNRESLGTNGTADPLSDKLQENIKQKVLNFEKMLPQYNKKRLRSNIEVMPVYLIATTLDIINRSQQLWSFVAAKENQGFKVQVINELTWGGGTGSTAADNLRFWLQRSYACNNIQYVLLIGNPDPENGDVPMKMCWPRYNQRYDRECPTDLYYADLTGNWDLNNDGYYGDYSDDCGLGGADRNFEVIVGRIPYYGSINDLDRILAKTIKYINTPASTAAWRSNALLAMEPSDGDTPGCHLGEAIKNKVLVNKKGWGWHRIYDETYDLSPVPETTPCNPENVTSVWQSQPFGIVFWWTHGSPTNAADIMDIYYARQLNDNCPSFTYQCSCNNSWPEISDNLSYTLLTNGSISSIGGTRVTWYWIGQTEYEGTASNSGMTYEYAKRIIDDEFYAGQALQDVKSTIYPENDAFWMNFLGFVLYGDPAIGLYTVK
jgi:hypothetical protein